MNIRDAVQKYPRFALPLQYSPVSNDISSTICFYNYFSQIFPKHQIDADLLLFLLDENGNNCGFHSVKVPSSGFVQVELKKIFQKSTNGMVGAMAIPQIDIFSLPDNGLPLQSQISTGYYITWEDSKGHVDIMHEWSALAKTPEPSKHFYFTVDCVGHSRKWNVVLMNNTLDHSSSEANLTIYNRQRKELGSIKLPAINPLGTQTVNLHKFFPGLDQWLREFQFLGVSVSGQHLAGPLTMEVYPSGDFHIHHVD